VNQLERNVVIMPTAVVSTITLMHPKGILEDDLVTKVEWLKQEIEAVGGKTGGIESS
jgi:hypothetical protein